MDRTSTAASNEQKNDSIGPESQAYWGKHVLLIKDWLLLVPTFLVETFLILLLQVLSRKMTTMDHRVKFTYENTCVHPHAVCSLGDTNSCNCQGCSGKHVHTHRYRLHTRLCLSKNITNIRIIHIYVNICIIMYITVSNVTNHQIKKMAASCTIHLYAWICAATWHNNINVIFLLVSSN